MPQANLDLLEEAATKLKPLLPEIAFVGGCVTELLITDPAAPAVRITYDVDVIVEVASYADYTSILSERLRALGFSEDDRKEAPLCRWVHGDLMLDVMTSSMRVIGFSNRWYADGLRTSQTALLPSGAKVRVIDGPHFLGTKFEAFHDRGKNDYVASHDLEDIIAVVDGRPAILEEVRSSSSAISSYLQKEFANLLETPAFLDALPGFLESGPAASSRLMYLHDLLKRLSSSF